MWTHRALVMEASFIHRGGVNLGSQADRDLEKGVGGGELRDGAPPGGGSSLEGA